MKEKKHNESIETSVIVWSSFATKQMFIHTLKISNSSIFYFHLNYETITLSFEKGNKLVTYIQTWRRYCKIRII